MGDANLSILVVDDEENVLASLRRLLRGEGYNVLTALTGEEALRILAAESDSVGLVIADNTLPGISGVEFLRAVREGYPDVVRVMLTGNADLAAAIAAINDDGVYRFQTKPWEPSEFPLVVKQGLEQFRLLRDNRRMRSLIEEQNQRLKELNGQLQVVVDERTTEVRRVNDALQETNQRLQATFVNTVRFLTDLIESRNPAMSGHGRRVATLSRHIAQRMGLSEDECNTIEVAALLHDVGKIGLPDDILQKSERALLPYERTLRRRHPIIGQAAMQIVDHMEPIGNLIRSHHERWDGQGYPDGLRGEAIPLGARIIAVANGCDLARELTGRGLATFLESLSEPDVEGAYDPSLVLIVAALKDEGVDSDSPLEQRVPVRDLQPGMVLARDIRAITGILLVAKGQTVQSSYLDRLVAHVDSKLIPPMVNVYKPDPPLPVAQSA